MNDNLKQKTITKVKEYIPEYKAFMGINYFPKFDIIPFSNKQNMHVNFEKSIPELFINETYTSILKSKSKPGIFHEFTHILDNKTLLPDLENKEKEPLIKTYSEYHAVQVQMKASLKFYNYQTEYYFSKDTKVNDWFDNKTVKEDVIYKTNDFVKTIQTLISRENCTYGILLHSIYYLSKIDFWNTYCKDDLSQYIAYDFLEILYKNVFKSYQFLLQNCNCSIKDFERIYNAQTLMMKDFIRRNPINDILNYKYKY